MEPLCPWSLACDNSFEAECGNKHSPGGIGATGGGGKLKLWTERKEGRKEERKGGEQYHPEAPRYGLGPPATFIVVVAMKRRRFFYFSYIYIFFSCSITIDCVPCHLFLRSSTVSTMIALFLKEKYNVLPGEHGHLDLPFILGAFYIVFRPFIHHVWWVGQVLQLTPFFQSTEI